MSKAPEQNIPMGPDEAAARAHEVSSHGSAYWLHQKRVWKAPELRKAFLAGMTHARSHPADPSHWAVGYAKFELAFCDLCGLEGNVPPALARETLAKMQAELCALREKVSRMGAEKAPAGEAASAAQETCPACGAAPVVARGPEFHRYACGSVRRTYHDVPYPMLSQSTMCVHNQMLAIRDEIRRAGCGG